MTILAKYVRASCRSLVDERLARHLESEFGWIRHESHLEECMNTIIGMMIFGKWDLCQLKHVFWTILWGLPVCLELRKQLTLKYFRMAAAAIKLYQEGAPGALGARGRPAEMGRQVKIGVAFIRTGTQIILQELPKYRAVLSSKKLIVPTVLATTWPRERKGITK